MAMIRAVFIDKDGTLIPDIPYNVDPTLITLAPNAGETLRHLKQAGYALIVISNQSGIARGLFAESALIAVENRLNALLQRFGIALDGFYYCPHLPDAPIAAYRVECACRKPKSGLLEQAARDLDIDLHQSWMIGDIAADCEAGNRVGCQTILIEKPYDPQREFTPLSQPDFLIDGWDQVSQIILKQETIR
jgi:D,D-heptose 1,7-bisphosphate phosphatase